MKVKSLPWLNDALGGGFAKGGVYLLAGQEGAGKSTLMLQATCDLARRGVGVIYLTTERPADKVEAHIRRITGSGRAMPSSIRNKLAILDGLQSLGDLPEFLRDQVLSDSCYGLYRGFQVIVLDSAQGRGIASTAREYRFLDRFFQLASREGITTITLAHVNKAGQIAGPKTLQHNVDVVLFMRFASRLRPLFVTKNRYGPAVLDPIPLEMDNKGLLSKSRLAMAKASMVCGYGGKIGELAEAQASVSLPDFDTPSTLNAPRMSPPKVKHIIKVLKGLKGVDLDHFTRDLYLYLTDDADYSGEFDLALAVALLSSYLQVPGPEASVFVGELDLMRRVRPPKPGALDALASTLKKRSSAGIKRVYLSESSVSDLQARLERRVEVIGVSTLDQLTAKLWPGLVE